MFHASPCPTGVALGVQAAQRSRLQETDTKHEGAQSSGKAVNVRPECVGTGSAGPPSRSSATRADC